jgi:hypothetical protein
MSTAMIGIISWLALIALSVVLAFKLGELFERSRWLVLVRQAAELRDRAAGMLRLLDDTVVLIMHGWQPLQRDVPPRMRNASPPPRSKSTTEPGDDA